MAVTNNNVKGLDLPIWEVVQPLPAASAAGACMCNDERGTNRYSYVLLSATSFWRYDHWTNTYQQLTSPPSGTFGIGTCMVYDPTYNTNSGGVWVILASAGAPVFYVYDVTLHTWAGPKSVVNLPGTIGTDAQMVHTDSAYNVAGNDDFIYLVGNAGSVIYRYSISGNAWIATLAALPAVTGAGCSAHWLYGWNTGKLVVVRGGLAKDIYIYDIAGNTWTTPAYQPQLETFTTGTMAIPRAAGTKLLIQKDATMRVFQFDPAAGAAGTMEPAATQYLALTGAALVGDRFVVFKEPTSGLEFLYVGLHTSALMLRSPIVIP